MTIFTWKFRRSRDTSQEEELRGKLLLEAEERARRRLLDRENGAVNGGFNVGNHGNMWNIISWNVMKRNLWNVDQAPKCCDISLVVFAWRYRRCLPIPATSCNDESQLSMTCLFVGGSTTTSLCRATLLRCYALRPGVSSRSWSKGPKKPWRWRLWMARQFIASSHKWPSQDCFETKAWLVDVCWYVNSIFMTMTCMTHYRKG